MAMETIWQDVRYGFRGLRRNPGFSTTAIFSLVLGIGASLAIFTVTDNLLLRPLPYRDAGRLTMVWEKNLRRERADHNVVSPGNYLDWKRQNDVFESMAGFRDARSVLTVGNRSEEVAKQIVTAELLPMLGVQPLRGRLFTAEDDRPGAENVADHQLPRSGRAGSAAIESVIGRKVQINSTPATDRRRAAAGILLPEPRDRSVGAAGLDPAQDYRKTQGRWMFCLARLKPGVTPATAQAHMAALAKRLEAQYPEFDTNWSVNVEPLRDSMVRDGEDVAAGAARRGRAPAGGRVRQRREPAAGAIYGPAARDRGADVAGRRAGAPHPPIADRERAARARGRTRRASWSPSGP